MKTEPNIILEYPFKKYAKLQKEIIENFIPRFAKNAEVIYIGENTSNMLFSEDVNLKKLFLFDLFDTNLPDIIAYDENKNWLYLIETAYSSGPMSEIRMLELKKALTKCTAELIFITAFIYLAGSFFSQIFVVITNDLNAIFFAPF